MKLSLCMIVKNEQETLAKCLNSVKGIVDEIIIVDTGSTDKTPKIAQQFGAKVHSFNWCDDFAKARNAALSYATGQWILVLDADEVLAPGIGAQLHQIMENRNLIVVNLIRQEIGASQSPYSLVSRLFRNHPQICFSRPYHAMVDDSVTELIRQKPQWQIGTLPQVAILHEGYQAEAIAKRNKWQLAKTSMERYLAEHPTDAYAASKLGALYVEIGDLERGIELLKLGLSQESNGEDGVLYELHYHLGIAYSKQGQFTLAKQHYQTAVDINILPQLKLGAYNNLGNIFKQEGELESAKIAYQTAIEIDPGLAIAYYNLGMTLRAMGAYREAIAAYQKALEFNPNSAETFQNLGVLLLQIGQLSDSSTMFKAAIELHEQNNSPEAQRLRQELGEMGFRV
ncbi:tetratricopeptide repeat protein [Planktothrix sp. PCC 11201]|uniref:tetratricopeptide repeat protein n=1 Tax=Planktothrix sp. PCC 11201 TaxID=1729650 RepID=UPI0009A8C6FC|nr:tetratricopeptide repeat protein [Planktothrix sp. PCC 11201]